MKVGILLGLLLWSMPAFAQSFRGVDQRLFTNRNASTLNNGALPASAVVLGTNASKQIITATVQGSGDSKVQLASGSTTTGDCMQYDANGGASDSGIGCPTKHRISVAASMVQTFYGGL